MSTDALSAPAGSLDAAGEGSAAGHVNAHTHLYSALAPLGLPAPGRPPRDFLEILGGVWWRLDRALDERTLRAAARLYAAEALLAGTTTLVDHHESPAFIDGSLDVLADACDELGIRALLCYGATERNGGRDEARRGLAECRRFVLANRRAGMRGVIGLHASFTVSDDTLREAGELARALGTVTHVHLAEDRADVEDSRRRGAEGPLERMLGLDALPPGSILAHGVWLDERQVRLARDRGLWLVNNPRSNRNNRVGYAGALAASPRVALGTDGFPADMDAELAALLDIARAEGDPARPPVFVARLDAGRWLAAERFGAGALAGDAVEWRRVAAGGSARAERVTVAGRVTVADGRLVSGDLEAIRAEAREAAPALWARMRELPWPA